MPNNNYCQKLRELTPRVKKLKELIETYKEEGKEEIYQEANEILREVERFYEISSEKSAKALKRLWRVWKENLNKIEAKKSPDKTFSFIYSLPLPEIPPFLLERISNQFLKKFDWENIEELFLFTEDPELGYDLPLFLSAFLKKNIENYVSSQKNQGLKEEEIKPIRVRFKVKELPVTFSFLGFQNPKKLHLIIRGDCKINTGYEMQGGKIVVEGNCGDNTGEEMQGGTIIVRKNCGNFTGQYMQGGTIIVRKNCGHYVGYMMQGGKIVVEGNCGDNVGIEMKNGEVDIKRKIKSFDDSAFSPENQGIIIWKGIKIWEKGKFTKEGEEMRNKGEIPM